MSTKWSTILTKCARIAKRQKIYDRQNDKLAWLVARPGTPSWKNGHSLSLPRMHLPGLAPGQRELLSRLSSDHEVYLCVSLIMQVDYEMRTSCQLPMRADESAMGPINRPLLVLQASI